MDERAAIYCDRLDEHEALLRSLGGLPETAVENAEWLYMLEEDTRQSLAIEGHFATEEDLQAVLQGRKKDLEIQNHFRMAQTAYDLALQYYRDNMVQLSVAMVRHIHSELFRELDTRRGEFRCGGIQIHGAKVRPPEFDVASYVQASLALCAEFLDSLPILQALARFHALFESIHPFVDGNGRVGRILLNYVAISSGYPPIVIKGVTQADRQRYYAALEAADPGFHDGFPNPSPDALRARLDQGHFDALSLLLCEGLSSRLDRMIAIALERHEPLLEFKDLSPALGVREDTLRQWVHRGKLIAIKRGKKLYSHPHLILPHPPSSRRSS